MPIKQQIKVPLLAVNDTALTVVDICFKEKDAVKKGDVVIVFESSKTTYDVLAETNGFISYSCIVGGDYEVNVTIANIFEMQDEIPDVITENKSSNIVKGKFEEAEAIWEGDTLFSPSAVALIKSRGVDVSEFKGRDFVSKVDVEKYLGIYVSDVSKSNNKKSTNQLPIDLDKVTVEKLSANKKREIEYLSSIQQTGLTSTINTIVDVDGVFVHLNNSFKYFKNSLLPVIIYETARLLPKYKLLNAYYTADAIAYYKQVNIGFAIDIEKGLKVLRVKNASENSMLQIEEDVMNLSNKYLDDKLDIEDITDVSFTITDLSSEAVGFFRPLVNMMNSAILGVSAIDDKLQRCILSVTFDHRVTEGKLVAQFLKDLKSRIESYRSSHFSHATQNISCFKCFKNLNDDLSDVGFSKCITPKGEDAYICQSCLKGF